MGDCRFSLVRDQEKRSEGPLVLGIRWGRNPIDLSLLLLDPGFLNDFGHLGHGLNDDGGGGRPGRLGWGCNDIRNLDGALLELGGELLVQEVTNHENCNDRHDVEDVKGGLGGDFLDDGTLGVVNDVWGAHY